MSKSRTLPTAGFIAASKLPRGPNGLPLCRWCGAVETASSRREVDALRNENQKLTDLLLATEQLQKGQNQ